MPLATFASNVLWAVVMLAAVMACVGLAERGVQRVRREKRVAEALGRVARGESLRGPGAILLVVDAATGALESQEPAPGFAGSVGSVGSVRSVPDFGAVDVRRLGSPTLGDVFARHDVASGATVLWGRPHLCALHRFRQGKGGGEKWRLALRPFPDGFN